jgi:hypothetical protein
MPAGAGPSSEYMLHTRYKKQRPALKKPEPDAHAPLKDAEQGLMLGS